MSKLETSLIAPFLLSASITSAQDSIMTEHDAVTTEGFVVHDLNEFTPTPNVLFNETIGPRFANARDGGELPPKSERSTVLPSSMSGVGRLIGIEEDGQKTYLCAMTVITPPKPFKITGNGNDIGATAGHCIPNHEIESYAGEYVGYEVLFTNINDEQITVPVETIHHNQTNRAINLSHISIDELSMAGQIKASKYLSSTKPYTIIFDTAIVQFAEPVPGSVLRTNVEFNALNDVTDDRSVHYFGYPRNTRGLTTDPEAKIGEIGGSYFISDAYHNNGSSGGINFHNGNAIGVIHGGRGTDFEGEDTVAEFFSEPLTDDFNTMVARIDYAAPYVNAPFLELDNSDLEMVSIRSGTETNLLPSAEVVIPGRKPVLEDEGKQYTILDRQNGYVGILIEDPGTAVFSETNLFYVPEESILTEQSSTSPNTTNRKSNTLAPLPFKR